MKRRFQKCKKIKNDRPRQLGPFPRFCHIMFVVCIVPVSIAVIELHFFLNLQYGSDIHRFQLVN